jgi:integrase
MRQGELLGLQWGDIDWSDRQIHVRRAFKDGAFTQPKTRNSQRKVDVPDFLLRELKAWKLRCPMLPKEHYGSTDRLAQLIYGSAAPTGSPSESSPSTANRKGPRRLERIAS